MKTEIGETRKRRGSMNPIVSQGAFWYMLIFGVVASGVFLFLVWLGCEKLALGLSVLMLLLAVGVDIALIVGFVREMKDDGRTEINLYTLLFATATQGWLFPAYVYHDDYRRSSF
jgi:hypothetical protein